MDFKRLFVGLLLIGLTSCTKKQLNDAVVQSPSGKIKTNIYLNNNGQLAYSVSFNDDTLIHPSHLGFEFSDSTPIKNNLKIVKINSNSENLTWKLPWGEKLNVINAYNELIIQLQEVTKPNRKINITFRLFDDGLGFRYTFPEQAAWDEALISEEKTQFNLLGNHDTWWIPGDWDSYEHLYTASKLSEIDVSPFIEKVNIAQSRIPENALNTPVTMRTNSGVYLSFHEAALTDYAGMTLKVDTAGNKLESNLVGSVNLDHKVRRKLPFSTPWRTIQIAKQPGTLIESDLILNLNEPNKLGDVSWVKPMKYMGIWWELHLGKTTWNNLGPDRHGATTENAKKYIDFASQNNIGGLLVEGWNTGWENWTADKSRVGIFDFVTSYPNYNLDSVVAYANKKGVELIMHHETVSAVPTYNAQLDTAFSLMKSHGIHAVKTGYVGPIIPEGEYHHGQYMVKHYREVLEKAADNQVAVNAHEPIKATGIRRTYPNAVSREGLRGQEFNAWSDDGGNPPSHIPTVAFTRMLAGPIDYTPGIFHISLNPYKPSNQVNTTIAQQLALFVVLNSPVQMAADLPENYQGKPGLQFIRDVPVNWQETKVLDGKIGEFVAIARKERDSEAWFLGAANNENRRNLEVKFDFLEENQEYSATIYRDSAGAHYRDNPTSLKIEDIKLIKSSVRSFTLAPGGGLAISLVPAKK